jgi:signal transduction histidine kinase
MRSKDGKVKGTYLFTLICGIVLCIISALIIAGWIFKFYYLLAISPDWPIIKLNTAISYLFLSICIILLVYSNYSTLSILIIKSLSFLAFLICGITIVEITFDLNIIKELFLPDYCHDSPHFNCNPSFLSSFNIMIIAGICFFKHKLSNYKNGEDQYILFVPIFISIFCILCYLYGSNAVLKAKWTTISFTSPVLLLLLSFAIIFLEPDRGWLKIALSKTGSGDLLRNMIIPNIIIFPVIGILRIQGELKEFYDSSLGLTIMVTSEIIIVTCAIIMQGKRLYKVGLDLRNTADELKQKNDQFAKINNDLDNFVYTASHDIKAPVNNIEGLLNSTFDEIEKECKPNEIMVGNKEMLNESIRKLKITLEDLANTGKDQLLGKNISPVPFKEIVEEVKINLHKLIEEGKPIFTEDYQVPSIMFSRKNLRSILQNLISNAIKYCPPERAPIIKISTQVVDGFILLKVSDNGIGISEKDKPKVFEIYTRIHTEKEGTGVGLNIVARIVNNNGGKIIIDSQEGIGSTFYIYLKEEKCSVESNGIH